MKTEQRTTFAELREPLTAALRRLIAKEDELHPFVVAEERDGPRSFVQFAGARDRPLVYDCPPLHIYNERCMLDVAVERGIEGLERQGVEPASTVWIVESERRPRLDWRRFLQKLLPA